MAFVYAGGAGSVVPPHGDLQALEALGNGEAGRPREQGEFKRGDKTVFEHDARRLAMAICADLDPLPRGHGMAGDPAELQRATIQHTHQRWPPPVAPDRLDVERMPPGDGGEGPAGGDAKRRPDGGDSDKI